MTGSFVPDVRTSGIHQRAGFLRREVAVTSDMYSYVAQVILQGVILVGTQALVHEERVYAAIQSACGTTGTVFHHIVDGKPIGELEVDHITSTERSVLARFAYNYAQAMFGKCIDASYLYWDTFGEHASAPIARTIEVVAAAQATAYPRRVNELLRQGVRLDSGLHHVTSITYSPTSLGDQWTLNCRMCGVLGTMPWQKFTLMLRMSAGHEIESVLPAVQAIMPFAQ